MERYRTVIRENEDFAMERSLQNVQEVWFPGCHADVGGKHYPIISCCDLL